MKKQNISEQPIVTRAAKKNAVKQVIRELLTEKQWKHNDLIEAAANAYAQRFAGEDTENINDVRGRIGSVLDIMKKEEEVAYEGGMYALKTKAQPVIAEENPQEVVEEKTSAPKKRKTKTVEKEEKKTEKKTVKRTAKAKKETTDIPETKPEETPVNVPEHEEKKEEEVLPLPPAPLQPVAPVAPITPEVAPEPIPQENPPKKRGRKTTSKAETAENVKVKKSVKTKKEATMSALNEEKTAEKAVETVTEQAEETVKTKEAPAFQEEKTESFALVQKPKAEVAPKNVVMDMSFLFGDVKKDEKKEERKEVKEVKEVKAAQEVKETKEVLPVAERVETTAKTAKTEKPEQAELPLPAPITAEVKEVQVETKSEEKPKTELPKKDVKAVVKPVEKVPAKVAAKPVEKASVNNDKRRLHVEKAPAKPLTADEKLREAFLRKIRSLGGDYFEYYSVYLLEKYSRRNGRRLEGLRVTGGGHDGGIDGEIELTDKLGFKETIYIQSKNWNPEKGDERLWVVGETLLQQFIGACACRQAKEGKQHCRGIFITTSRFTPDAKRILEDMSDKIVGYDGEDLYEAAKECEFGVIKKNGNWVLDEQLLSGEKAFFNML